MSDMLRISVTPHEILFPASEIVVESDEPLDPQVAQEALVLRGQRGSVRLDERGRRAAWTPAEPLTPGRHVLTVGELMTSGGRRIGAKAEIPFFVTDSVAKVPPTLRVESFARLRVGEDGLTRLPADRRDDGAFVEMLKAVDRESGEPVALAFDEAGRRIDADELLAALARRRAERYGKLHPALHEQMRRAGSQARLPVAIWLDAPEAEGDDRRRAKEPPAQPTAAVVAHRERIAAITERMARELEREHEGSRPRRDPLAPAVYAELTEEQVRAVARRDDVLAVFLHETEGIEDLGDSIAIAQSNDAHTLGFKGSGVKVAVWEDGPDDTSNLTIAAFFDPSQASTSSHARHTHAIVRNKEKNKPKGHAPSCSLYSANSKDLSALAWAVKEQGCTVVSQSFHRSSEPGSSGMSYDDIYKDWLALHWPYPTIVQAAGNFWSGDPDNINPPSSEYVNHKGYNSLAVGNHDDEADAMSGSSVFRNPSSSHGDRELPEIAANGTSVTTVGLTLSGTSMAAPAAAGCAALVQNVNGTLKSWPEGCRAILLAGATRNVAGSTWWQDVIANVDAADGSGAVNALESVRIAQSRRSRNAAATRRGWDIGLLTSGDVGAGGLSTFSYRVKLPKFFFGPRHVKVALAWSSHVGTLNLPLIGEMPFSSHLAVDLDLKVFNSAGQQVGYSGSWDNSYEIAEFTGHPGETYTIRIRRWSGTESVYYGIAWTVTGGLLLASDVLVNGGVIRRARDLAHG